MKIIIYEDKNKNITSKYLVELCINLLWNGAYFFKNTLSKRVVPCLYLFKCDENLV